jgi:hypothetical protein
VGNSRGLSLERRKRAELFQILISKHLLGSIEPVAYLNVVESILMGLGASLGATRGLGRFPGVRAIRNEELLEGLEPPHIPELYQWSLSMLPETRDGAVEWVFDNRARRNSGSYYTPPEPVSQLLRFALPSSQGTICDPSCGAGAFLIAAAKVASEFKGRTVRQVLEDDIFGCDTDPIALRLCRLLMWLETGALIPEENLICADALTLDWPVRFPKVFADGGFDTVIGNPPFGAVVDGRVPEHAKQLRTLRFPELGGTADFSFYFASLARSIVKPEGKIGLVLPRAFLSARSARGLRDGRLGLIQSCTTHNSFDGAAVYVCLVGFGPTISGKHISRQIELQTQTLQVTASLTVSEAYDLAPQILNRKSGTAPKLLTTGLINPGSSLWGEVTCRYLRCKYSHPRAPAKSLRPTRRAVAKRPKLLVAGLSRTIECFLDTHAEYVGAVSTYTITHPNDDLQMLERAMKHLHSDEVSARFRRELGSAALGGGNITLTKRFLHQVLAESGF